MSRFKCSTCGPVTEVDEDPSRGDIVCKGCGAVLEDQQLTSSTTFEETSSGNTLVHGHFVASNSTGGSANVGGNTYSTGRLSNEITLSTAERGINQLCQQLRISSAVSRVAVNHYERLLKENKTRGRNRDINYGACIYLACRSAQTDHLLIDISEVLQIDVYELGKTYLHFARKLCIQVKEFDPSLYVARFARELDFGNKINLVITTASKIVKRMVTDNIHTGRRPSGLCGAALLLAARLHDFNRTPNDIIKIVQVHESTLRKRLIEFGDTPSSALTLTDFDCINLEAEQDPPAFKAARKKDRERYQQLDNIDTNEFNDLQREIEKQLDEQAKSKSNKRKRKNTESIEEVDTNRFIKESTMKTINSFVGEEANNPDDPSDIDEPIGLGPDVSKMGLASSLYDTSNNITIDPYESTNGELDMTGLDDDELDSYILSEKDTDSKANLWNKVNADYLKKMEEKEAQRLKDIEEGKPEKKKRKTGSRKKNQPPARSAGEAMEKMIQEKKLSSKINYDVLKSLDFVNVSSTDQQEKPDEVVVTVPEPVKSSSIIYPIKLNKLAPKIPLKPRSPKKDVKIETKIETKIEIKSSPKKQDNFDNVADTTVNEEAEDIDDYDYDNDEEAEPDEDEIGHLFGRQEEKSYYDEEEY